MSADNIIKRIERETATECEGIVGEAKAAAAKILGEADENAALEKAAIEGKAQKDCDEIIRRRMQIAELDIRKQILATKRLVLDKVMEGAMQKLCALPEAEWEALITKLALRYAVTGEEKVRANAAERGKFEALLPAVNEKLAKAGKAGKLSLAGESAAFAGGFALAGEKIELNCSYEVLLREAQAQCEKAVVAKLFPVGV